MLEGSTRRTTDGKNGQGKRAKDTRKKRGDEAKDQTSSGSTGLGRRITHFFTDMVVFTTAATAVISNLPLAEGLSHNALDVRDGGNTQLSRRDASGSALESRQRPNSICYPSRDTGRNHDEFPQKISIGDSWVALPTMDDIGQLQNDQPLLLKNLKSVCENPRLFNQVVSNENFRRIILSIAQDENALDFMYNLCDEVKTAFLDADKAILNSLDKGEKKSLNSLIKAIGNILESRDRSVQNLPSYEKTSQGISHEVVLQKPFELANKFLDYQHEKDHMRAMRDIRKDERLDDILDDLVQKKHEKGVIWMEQDSQTKERLERQPTEEVDNLWIISIAALSVISLATACYYKRKNRHDTILHSEEQSSREPTSKVDPMRIEAQIASRSEPAKMQVRSEVAAKMQVRPNLHSEKQPSREPTSKVDPMRIEAQIASRSEPAKMQVRSAEAKMQVRSDGAKIQVRSDGAKMQVRSDGAKMQVRSDGAKMQVRSDGAEMQSRLENAEMQSRLEKAKIQYVPDEAKMQVRSDKAKAQHRPDEVKMQVRSDKAKIKYNLDKAQMRKMLNHLEGEIRMYRQSNPLMDEDFMNLRNTVHGGDEETCLHEKLKDVIKYCEKREIIPNFEAWVQQYYPADVPKNSAKLSTNEKESTT
jgi:hypothetical protein